MPTRNPDSLPIPSDPTGPCPWCGRVSNFSLDGPTSTLKTRRAAKGPRVFALRSATLLACHGCKAKTVVVTDQGGEGVMWWPTPGAGTLDSAVHSGVASAYDEGMRCHAVGAHRAAAVMFRSALHLFVKDKGSPKAASERHLKTALKQMKADGDLHKSLWDWAEHLNQIGNEGAHPEDYDDVTKDEADGLGKFVRHLIRHEYEMPAQLLRDQGLLVDEPVTADEAPEAPEPPAPIVV